MYGVVALLTFSALKHTVGNLLVLDYCSKKIALICSCLALASMLGNLLEFFFARI